MLLCNYLNSLKISWTNYQHTNRLQDKF